MLDASRLRHPSLFEKVVTPEEAASLITDGMHVGVAGFTPSGYPKKTTLALAAKNAGLRFGAARRSDRRLKKHSRKCTACTNAFPTMRQVTARCKKASMSGRFATLICI